MVVLLLIACARCPTFAEMGVTDPDGVADEGLVAEIAGAVADFQAWTGREGVCVPSIRVEADVPEEEPSSDIVGLYQGDREPILLQAHSSLSAHDIVIHELCHALDRHEGLSESWPAGAFDADDVTEDRNYPTSADRAHEDFARTCDDGPVDLALVLALDAKCGTESWGADGKFIASTVYTGFPTAVISAEPFAVAIDARPVDIGAEYWVYGAVGVGQDVFVLAGRPSEGDAVGPVGVLRIDPASGAVGEWVEVHRAVPGGWVRLAASEDGVVALISSPGRKAGQEATTQAVRFDPAIGTVADLGLRGLPADPSAAAYVDGTLYVAGYSTGLSAWDTADGSRVDIDGDLEIARLVPTPSGLEKENTDGVFRLVDGSWVQVVTKPQSFWSFVALGEDQRLWLGGSLATPALFDGALSQWRLPEDPCSTEMASNVSILTVDGSPFVLGETEYGSGVPVLFGLELD